MPFTPNLLPGDIITNDQLCAVFGCGTQGGMRKSNATQSLVLISNHITSIYDDRWVNDVFHYTGMGQTGDQQVDWMQNGTLRRSDTNGIQVFLFEVYTAKQYLYHGPVQLVGEPYAEYQFDQHDTWRQVWVFPLQRLDPARPAPVPSTLEQELWQGKVRQARKALSAKRITQLEQQASTPRLPTTSLITTKTFSRDVQVVAYALERAQGHCELCQQPAPFLTKEGLPFLEVHHIEYLAQGGSDSINNVSAVCPNCHRRLHALARKADKAKLLRQAARRLSNS